MDAENWSIAQQKYIILHPEEFEPKAAVKDVLLTRIQRGAGKSSFTTLKYQSRIAESMVEQEAKVTGQGDTARRS
jgi:hypothetical protein